MSAQPELDLPTTPVVYGSLTYRRGAGPQARGTWILDARPQVTIRAKRVFPRAKADTQGRIEMADSAEVCRDLDWFTERYPLTLDPASKAALERGVRRHRDTEDAVAGDWTPTCGECPPRSRATTSSRQPTWSR